MTCYLYFIFSLLTRRFWINFLRNFIFRKLFQFIFCLISSLFIFITILLFLYFLQIHPYFYTKNDFKNENLFVLQRTVVFPRGGDNLEFDQPWDLSETKIYENIDEVIRNNNRIAKYITGDFTYR
ncbi:unnamed protein product [Meloidogyne enterolobii]|uniref:Uncharacterized protein n=1 Tax=Meloidogyne enterolobii TaxID=390850 RepID=A0ACB0Y7L1_MELEN